MVQAMWVDGDQIKGGLALSRTEGWESVENKREEESGCLPHQEVFSQQQLRRRAAELFHYEFSLLWPLINNVALVLFRFFRKTCLFGRVVFFKVA